MSPSTQNSPNGSGLNMVAFNNQNQINEMIEEEVELEQNEEQDSSISEN
jgi:hypothetical protein